MTSPFSPTYDLIPVGWAAKYMTVSEKTLRRMIQRDEFPPAVRVGRKTLISVPKLERWLHG